jgi:hypothetical protein
MTLRYAPNGGSPFRGKCDLTRYWLAAGTFDFFGKTCTSGTIESIRAASGLNISGIWNRCLKESALLINDCIGTDRFFTQLAILERMGMDFRVTVFRYGFTNKLKPLRFA